MGTFLDLLPGQLHRADERRHVVEQLVPMRIVHLNEVFPICPCTYPAAGVCAPSLFADFEIVSRSRSFTETIDDRDSFEHAASDLLRKLMPLPKSIRLLGVSLATLKAPVCGTPQLTLQM